MTIECHVTQVTNIAVYGGIQVTINRGIFKSQNIAVYLTLYAENNLLDGNFMAFDIMDLNTLEIRGQPLTVVRDEKRGTATTNVIYCGVYQMDGHWRKRRPW